MANKVQATFHPHTTPTPPLTPEILDRLRNTRGEHLEGMEIVSIPRAQLDALIEALGTAKYDALQAAADNYLPNVGNVRIWLRARAELEAGK